LYSIPPGESPPPPPRVCFGRDELIEKIVGLAANLTPITLIGAGGIGKTSIALTVLHHDRIKQRFGNNRRFIRCDQFPASRVHFLSQLSKVIGAGAENPEDLTPLRPFLSSREMFLLLDNAESILDPQETGAREIYTAVEELSHFSNICLCITSRISIIPTDCETLNIPTLSMEAARDAFYRIYKHEERSDLVDKILGQLDFHPLSITLLATVAHHNQWNNNRIVKEWDAHRTRVLQTDHNESLAATIELSLASPMFCKLGPSAHDLLSVVAFFPQGVNEDNFDWLFPTISGSTNILDKFCTLSLAYRSNGFVTMLAPLRDHLRPKDTKSSPLLCATKDCYFSRLSVIINPGHPGFEEAKWITSEDVNVEHLLDAFTSIDKNSAGAWDACSHFMEHLFWHKKRLVGLGPKIEGLADDHPSKPTCLLQLSRLFGSLGNYTERRRLLTHALGLWRERGDNFLVAEALRFLSTANRMVGLYKEGIQQLEEALGIYKQLNNVVGQARSLQQLAWLLYADGQLDAAEQAAPQAIDLLSDKNNQSLVCDCHRILGLIYRAKGQTEKAIDHFEIALKIASPFNWHHHLFWNYYSLAELSFDEGRFDDAHANIERAKPHTINDPYNLGHAMELQARLWYKQHRFEEAKSEALRAVDVYEKLGAARDLERSRKTLQDIETATKSPFTSGGLHFDSAIFDTR